MLSKKNLQTGSQCFLLRQLSDNNAYWETAVRPPLQVLNEEKELSTSKFPEINLVNFNFRFIPITNFFVQGHTFIFSSKGNYSWQRLVYWTQQLRVFIIYATNVLALMRANDMVQHT